LLKLLRRVQSETGLNELLRLLGRILLLLLLVVGRRILRLLLVVVVCDRWVLRPDPCSSCSPGIEGRRLLLCRVRVLQIRQAAGERPRRKLLRVAMMWHKLRCELPLRRNKEGCVYRLVPELLPRRLVRELSRLESIRWP